MSDILNAYGDHRDRPIGSHGCDISSQRLDDLDRACLAYVLAGSGTMTGLDLGCGLGTPSIAFAIAGAAMHLYDRADFRERFEELRERIPSERLFFERADLREVVFSAAPYRFCYSQRTLHYLTYREAQDLFRRVMRVMSPGGRFFVSASGLASPLSAEYPDAGKDVRDRFARLSDAVAMHHNILEPVCLYTADEMRALGESVGLETIDVMTSTFGNVKSIFRTNG